MLAEIYPGEGSGDHGFNLAVCGRSPYRLARRPNPAFHRALAICPPQLGAPLGFRTIQVYPKDLASALRQSERAVNRPNGPVSVLIGIGEEVPHAGHKTA
jgi:hypothetical protein